jgi:hypothetical protein
MTGNDRYDHEYRLRRPDIFDRISIERVVVSLMLIALMCAVFTLAVIARG